MDIVTQNHPACMQYTLQIIVRSPYILIGLRGLIIKSFQGSFLKYYIFIYFLKFIYSGYFYSASSSPLLLRGVPDTARILRRSFTPKRHWQL